MNERRPLTEQEKTASRNLRKIWDERQRIMGLTQESAAEKFGCNQSTISHYLNARIPLNLKAIIRFSDLLGVQSSDIDPAASRINNLMHENVTRIERRLLPMVTWEQLKGWEGVPSHFDPEDAKEWLPSPVAVGPRSFLLEVVGDSMTSPTGPSFPSGSIIIVDPDHGAANGKFVVVEVGESATFKQLVIDGPHTYLRPMNPQYQAIQLTEKPVILGVVRGMILKL